MLTWYDLIPGRIYTTHGEKFLFVQYDRRGKQRTKAIIYDSHGPQTITIYGPAKCIDLL